MIFYCEGWGDDNILIFAPNNNESYSTFIISMICLGYHPDCPRDNEVIFMCAHSTSGSLSRHDWSVSQRCMVGNCPVR